MSIADCAAIVERGDPDRFLSAMASPVEARAVLFPLYAFNVEVTRAPWASSEAMICEMRLQWWHDILGEIAENTPARAHEVVEPLTEVLRERMESVELLQQLVEARRWDIYREPFDGIDDFRRYIEATSANLMWVSAMALGAPEQAETSIRKVGWAAGLAALLRAVPQLESRGRRPLVDSGVSAIEELARQGLDMIATARRESQPSEAVPALLAGWRAETTLRRAVEDPARVVAGTLEESWAARRLSLMRRVVTRRW